MNIPTIPIAEKYKAFDRASIAELQFFPTLFAYEHIHSADARVGFLKKVTSRSGWVRIEYEFYLGTSHDSSVKPCRLGVGADIDKTR